MDGWMDGWMDGNIHEWTDGWMATCTNAWTDHALMNEIKQRPEFRGPTDG
jgi:hypothetical protein